MRGRQPKEVTLVYDPMLSWFAFTIVGGGLILCVVVAAVVLLLPALRGSRPSAARKPGDPELGRACPSCGTDNPVEHAFCDRCGASLRAE